ncbi:MAG: hypothetical protein AAF741_12635 [Bacteroidota bacterium]
MLKSSYLLLALCAGLFLFQSCGEELVEPQQDENTEIDFREADGGLETFISAEYDIANGYYVVSGISKSGDLDTYYGTTRNWTRQRDNRDVSQINGAYVATVFADDGTFTNFSIFNGEVTSNGGFTFSGAPRSNSGGAKVGDLVQFIDADYDSQNGYYVVSGKDASGEVDTYYGSTRNWTQQREDRDVSVAKGSYRGTAFADDGTFTNFSISNGEVNSNGGFTFSGAPRSNSGGARIGDLVEFIDADYDAANGYYVVSGKDASGEVDTYYGETRNWTKVQENRDVSVAKGSYRGTAFAADGTFTNFSIHNSFVNSNGGFTFYGAPRSNSGGAKVKE